MHFDREDKGVSYCSKPFSGDLSAGQANTNLCTSASSKSLSMLEPIRRKLARGVSFNIAAASVLVDVGNAGSGCGGGGGGGGNSSAETAA